MTIKTNPAKSSEMLHRACKDKGDTNKAKRAYNRIQATIQRMNALASRRGVTPLPQSSTSRIKAKRTVLAFVMILQNY